MTALTVSCENVSRSFARKTNRVDALSNVSLQLGAGEFAAIRGKSGCGKSTLMLCLGGLQKPDEGVVTVSGQRLYDLTADRRATFRASHIGFVFQQFHLVPYLTVLENIMAARLGFPPGRGRAKLDASNLVAQVDLGSRSDHKPAELSTGECQRVAIARALMNEPELVLADEPTGNLDEENTNIVLESLREIATGGKTVLLVTHDQRCERFVDRVFRMEAGRIVE